MKINLYGITGTAIKATLTEGIYSMRQAGLVLYRFKADQGRIGPDSAGCLKESAMEARIMNVA